GVDRPGVDVLVVDLDAAGDAATGDGVVHPVHGPQEGRLAAARGTDQGGDRLVRDVQRDFVQGLLLAIEDRDVAGDDLGRGGRLATVPRCRRGHGRPAFRSGCLRAVWCVEDLELHTTTTGVRSGAAIGRRRRS